MFPTIGDWYRDASGNRFEIVAVDEEDASIEIQYFDGALEELDLDSWGELGVEAIEPPEDWSGSLDIQPDDYGVDLDRQRRSEWANPLDEFEQ